MDVSGVVVYSRMICVIRVVEIWPKWASSDWQRLLEAWCDRLASAALATSVHLLAVCTRHDSVAEHPLSFASVTQRFVVQSRRLSSRTVGSSD